MKRRIFCLLLLVALTFGVLSSCVTPGGGKTCESCVDTNTEEEVDHILEVVPQVVQHLRNMSPVWRDLQTGKREYIL